MFKKFVQLTALLNFPIALGIMIPEMVTPQQDTFIFTVVLATFLMFAGAALLWAVSDIKNRASIIVWNGIVRLVGFFTVAYASSLGMAPTIFVVISGMDLIAAIIYAMGSVKKSGIPFTSLLLGKSITHQAQ